VTKIEEADRTVMLDLRFDSFAVIISRDYYIQAKIYLVLLSNYRYISWRDEPVALHAVIIVVFVALMKNADSAPFIDGFSICANI